MYKVVVTGATGFLGSWLVEELLKNGVEVVLFVRDRNKLLPEFKSNDRCTVIEKPILNISIDDFDFDNGYDAFYHLAWEGTSTEQKNIIQVQINNIELALKALELCKNLGCKKFIAAGTVAEHVFCNDIMNVNAKQTPNDMYGAAKTSAYYFLEVRARQLGQPFIWMIIPSTFGERRNDNNIITYTIIKLLNKERPQYGDLKQMWDFLYAGEVARAMYLIGEKGKTEKIYGIGSGEYRPLKEYIYMVRDLIDPTLELGLEEIPEMSKQTFSSCVNTYDLIKDTGFKPSINFEEGIKKTIDYWKRNIV
mgnify:CR=1 FL=1